MLKIFLKILIIISLYCDTVLSSELFEIKADLVNYKKDKDIIIAEGNAIATNKNRILSADKIIYDKKNKIIKTFRNSKFKNNKITLNAEILEYQVDLKIIFAKNNVKLIDEKNNEFNFKNFTYNELTLKGSGSNMVSVLSDGSYIDAENGFIDKKNNVTKLKNARYSTCDKIKNSSGEFCPSWSLNSKSVSHIKNKKKIVHKNSVLKLRNIPVFYTPYFSHPDPTVKRQSGFLPPLVKSISNIGKTLKVPYFWVLSEDKDITITPIYYFKEKSHLRTSYRQAVENGFLQVENGYSKGYERFSNQNRTKGSRNFFFLDFEKDLKKFNNINSKIKFKLQRVSQKNFLRVNQINTKLFKQDDRTLENSLNFTSFKNNSYINLKVGIFENLDISNNNKYTYYFPDGLFSKNINYKTFKNNINSFFQGIKFSDKQKQFKIRNLLSSNSKSLVYKRYGLNTVFKNVLYNNNIYNQKVKNQKDDLNIDNYFTFAIDTNMPFVKYDKNKYQTINPRIFIKYTTGKMLDASTSAKSLEFGDIFSINRTNDLDKPETGLSFGHGFDYKINRETFNENFKSSFGIGQVLKTSSLNKMPATSSLNKKSSDFAGFFKTEIISKKENNHAVAGNSALIKQFDKNNFSLNYKYNIDNNFKKINKNIFAVSGVYEKIFSSFKLIEKNNNAGNERSAALDIKKLFANNYYVRFEGKRNLKLDKSEFHNFSINYENDCIIGSLTLSRSFYSDNEVNNTKSLIFGITLKPFSDNIAPDLTSFIE